MKQKSDLFPPNTVSPYYINSPPYTRFSAGIKVLHLLCHHINLRGYPAYLIPTQNSNIDNVEYTCGLDLLTPLLKKSIAREHFHSGQTPITIYPEIITGNPLNSCSIVRYALNFPGFLGGDLNFPKGEMCYSYSKAIAKQTHHPDKVLFIPASDTRIFYPPKEGPQRSGSCFYASKYQKIHGGELLSITKNSMEITSGMPDSPTPSDIAKIFRSSEIFYTYENTALAIEATLCGCPVVFLPNAYLKEIIATEELGRDGFAWGNSEAEISRAKKTVSTAFDNYEKSISEFHSCLDNFISQTQHYAHNKIYENEHLQSLVSYLSHENCSRDRDESYAQNLKKLPWRVERQIGALLCTLGLEDDGKFLWNRATNRSKN